MFNVMIVDDEKWICELIACAVPWDDLGMRVAAVAHSGIDAMEAIRAQKIDVVVTDIRMPGMDGIGLIRQARAEGYGGRFVIISGHQDFEYAKSALQYNVTSYLVKPVDEDELTVILYKIAEDLRELERSEEDSAQMKSRLEIASRRMKEQFARLATRESGAEGALSTVDLAGELGFAGAHYVCVIFRVDGAEGSPPEAGIVRLLMDRLAEYMGPELERQRIAHTYYIDGQSAVYVLNFDGENRVPAQLKDHMGELKQMVGMYRNFTLTVGVGSEVDSLSQVGNSYQAADMAVKYRLVAGRNKLIESAALELLPGSAGLSDQQKRRITALVENMDAEGLDEYIKETLVMKDGNPAQLFELARKTAQFFWETLRATGYAVKADTRRAEEKMDGASSAPMLADCLAGILLDELAAFREEKNERQSRPVAAARDYVSRRFAEPISLSDAAAHVHLNPNYLSKLFKAETGETFLDYLTQCRVDAAKELLRDIGVKPSRIAQMVGYQDARHFSKTFKKVVGLTPDEYRKLYL